MLRESNLDKHPISNHALLKRGKVFNSATELKAHSATLLLLITCLGMTPYKMVEMWKNNRPLVPEKYQCDTLYAKPDVNVMAKVKEEKIYQAETGEVLKGKKKERQRRLLKIIWHLGDGGGSI